MSEEQHVDDAEIERVTQRLRNTRPRVPAAIDQIATELRSGGGNFATPDGERPVEINTDEAGWKNHPNTPSYPGESAVEEYVVDLHSFGNPLDPEGRMEWMRQMQAKIPPPDEDYESRSVTESNGTARVVGGPLRE